MILIELCIYAIGLNATLLLPRNVIFTCEFCEAPLARGHNLLTPRKLELCTPECLDSLGAVHILRSDGEHDLTDCDSCCSPLDFAKGAAHPSLEAICARAREHLVDTETVKRVQPHAKVELVLASILDHVLVGCNASSFHCFG